MKKSQIPLLLFTAFAIIFTIFEFHRIGDFKIFILASEALGNNENIYTKHFVAGFHYFYSPLFALITYPLTLIPQEIAGTIWNLASFIMLGRTFWLIQNMFLPENKSVQKIYLLTFAATIFPIYANFHQTQMSVFILFSIIESIYRVHNKNQNILGAAILALAINVKILPIVFIPYFIYRKEFKVAIYTVLFMGIFLLLPGILIGFKFNFELLASWWKLIDPLKSRNIIDINEPALHSITTLLSTLFTDRLAVNELNIKRNILTLDENTVYWVINLVRVGLVLFTFYFLRTWPFKKQTNPLAKLWEISYICLLIPIIFPHQQTYGFLLILPAIQYLIFYFLNSKPIFKRQWKYYMITSFGILAYLIINLELLLGLYRHYYWHFKTLTYGVLLLLVVLALSKPSKLKFKPDKYNI